MPEEWDGTPYTRRERSARLTQRQRQQDQPWLDPTLFGSLLAALLAWSLITFIASVITGAIVFKILERDLDRRIQEFQQHIESIFGPPPTTQPAPVQRPRVQQAPAPRIIGPSVAVRRGESRACVAGTVFDRIEGGWRQRNPIQHCRATTE